MRYRFGDIRPIQTRVVVAPLRNILERHSETLRWLDTYTPSSFALLGHLFADTFLQDNNGRTTYTDFARAFWNLFEGVQSGLSGPDEIPDRHYETVDVISEEVLKFLRLLKEDDIRQFGEYPAGASASILPVYDWRLHILISFPSLKL